MPDRFLRPHRLLSRPDFPAPLKRPRRAPQWLWSDIQAYAGRLAARCCVPADSPERFNSFPDQRRGRDLKATLAPVLLAGGGHRLVWLMNPLQAMSLSLQTDGAGTLVWPDAAWRLGIADVIMSPNVPAGTLLMVDAADFIPVADDVPQFEVLRIATLHLDDAPGTISDGTFASLVISMFQQDALAIRMVQQMNWTMLRPGMVAGVSGVQW